MKPSSSRSSTASSSSSITSLSSASSKTNHIRLPSLSKNSHTAGSGSFTIVNEKSLSLSSSSSSSSSSASSQHSDSQETSSSGLTANSNRCGDHHQQPTRAAIASERSEPAARSTISVGDESSGGGGSDGNGGDDDEPPIPPPPSSLAHDDFVQRLVIDYDGELEKLGDRATDAVANGSFFNFGLFQFLSFLFISVAWTVGNGWYAYVSVFTGYTPEHECDYERMGGNFTSLPTNHSLIESDESAQKCYAFDPQVSDTVKCTQWKYDSTQMRTTIITEYGFVCDKNYYFEVAYSIEQVGYIVGTLIFSFIADVIGRKPVMIAVLWSMSIFGFVQYFVNSFLLYIIIGFVINSLACGLEAVCVTLVLEMFSTSKRTLFGVGIQIVWVIVLASLSPLAYIIKSWREIRLVIFATLAVLSIFSSMLVQESVRWLISMSRLHESVKVLDRIAIFNRMLRPTSKMSDSKNGDEASSSSSSSKIRRFESRRKKLKHMLDQLDAFNKFQNIKNVSSTSSTSPTTAAVAENPNLPSSTQSTKKPSQIKQAVEMFKNSKFRLYVTIMALNWFATALVYDGLAYLNNFIGANIFVNWVLMNLIELPAQFVCYYLISRWGRRVTVALTLVLSGLTLLATLLVEYFESKSVQGLGWIKLLLFVAAKFIITQSYSAIIVHAPELFPTSLRSFGYGICLFSGKLTAVLSPLISFYVSKVAPALPAIIYGSLSMLCGIVSLYVPETLNRPLPNSVDDVCKWPRSLNHEERKTVQRLNDNELKLLFKCCYRIKTSKRTAPAVPKKKLTDEQQKCMHSVDKVNPSVVVVKNVSSATVLVEDEVIIL